MTSRSSTSITLHPLLKQVMLTCFSPTSMSLNLATKSGILMVVWNLCGYGLVPSSCSCAIILERFAKYCVGSSSSSSAPFARALDRADGAAGAAAARAASFSALFLAAASALSFPCEMKSRRQGFDYQAQTSMVFRVETVHN